MLVMAEVKQKYGVEDKVKGHKLGGRFCSGFRSGKRIFSGMVAQDQRRGVVIAVESEEYSLRNESFLMIFVRL